MSKKKNRKLLTKEEASILLPKLNTNWGLSEIPLDEAKEIIPDIPRRDQVYAVLCSGICYDLDSLNDDLRIINMHGHVCIAGVDVLCVEERPNIEKMEPEGNAYHLVFYVTNNINYPIIMDGPYNFGTRIEHWHDADDLSVYVD